jgi:hypothetical protein
MKNFSLRVIEFAKTRPLIFGLGVLLLVPGFIFGALFEVLGFIGWGRIFLALVFLAGYAGYKFVRYELDGYKETADNAVDVARSMTDLWK